MASARPWPTLDDAERQRYGRHLVLPEVGEDGQRRLKGSSVLVVGAGGLGSPVALYLAAAGVGRIGIVDFDAVDASNLQRQVLHGTRMVGRSKLTSAQERLADLNPHVAIELHDGALTRENALERIANYDVVADGTDNFATRYLVNDACALLGRPNVYASIYRFDGQVSVFDARIGPCYRCLYPEPPPAGLVPSCAEGGVLGVLPGVIGTLQANETLKLLLGIGAPLVGRLLLFDALAAEFRTLQLRKDPECPLCGSAPTLTALADYEALCGVGSTPGRTSAPSDAITPRELAPRLAAGDDIVFIDVREPSEHAVARVEAATLMPLGTLPDRLAELDAAREIVVMCHHGGRSQRAVDFLQRAGYTRARNLTGGIDAWSREVDPGVKRY